jgi:hypothetical protein
MWSPILVYIFYSSKQFTKNLFKLTSDTEKLDVLVELALFVGIHTKFTVASFTEPRVNSTSKSRLPINSELHFLYAIFKLPSVWPYIYIIQPFMRKLIILLRVKDWVHFKIVCVLYLQEGGLSNSSTMSFTYKTKSNQRVIESLSSTNAEFT